MNTPSKFDILQLFEANKLSIERNELIMDFTEKELTEKELKEAIDDYKDARAGIPEGWVYLGDDNERYVLGQPGQKNLLVIGVNPSTAKPEKLDPTIKKVIKISQEQGYSGWIMVNLHPQRATDPQDITPLTDTIMKNNIEVIRYTIEKLDIKYVWYAWGNLIDIFGKKSFLHDSQKQIDDLLKEKNVQRYHYYKLTKKGNYRHPLYAPKNDKLHKI